MTKNAKNLNMHKISQALKVIRCLRYYHEHEVHGIHHLPKLGPVILAFNHSLATYDAVMLMGAIYDATTRITTPLADHTFFKFPFLGEWIHSFGAKEGTPLNALKVLKKGGMIGVAPGGMKEALRDSKNKYQIYWENRLGFVKMSIKSGAPILLAACPLADDIYDVYKNPITNFIYEKFRLPFPVAKGLGFSFIPKPIKLIHHLWEPIYPPSCPKSKSKFEGVVKEHHFYVVEQMKNLMRAH